FRIDLAVPDLAAAPLDADGYVQFVAELGQVRANQLEIGGRHRYEHAQLGAVADAAQRPAFFLVPAFADLIGLRHAADMAVALRPDGEPFQLPVHEFQIVLGAVALAFGLVAALLQSLFLARIA